MLQEFNSVVHIPIPHKFKNNIDKGGIINVKDTRHKYKKNHVNLQVIINEK